MNAELANTMWSATSLAQDESTVKASALSVRQRKLLALLNTPMSVDGLSSASGLPHPEVETNLARFAKLGLAQARSDAAAAPAEFRSSNFSAGVKSSNPMPMIVGGIALTAVAAAIWWFTRAPSNSAPSAPNAASVSRNTAPAPLVSPSDVSTTNVFVPGAPAPAPATQTPADAAKLAAAKEREAAVARDAAKNAKNAPTATAPSPVAASPTAPSQTPISPAPVPAPVVAATTPPAAPPPAATAPVSAPPTAATPATQVAAAPAPAPRATAPAAPREGALLSRVEPSFPRNAEIDRGTVRARLTVNGTGAVTGVDIVEANPPRVFDRNVRTALLQWRYEGTGETQTKLVEVQFSR